ncbi:uncharacterized protein LOC134504338 [Candoia aspera]|uniref:uncharacterized protein LOC134504338 n=1 Tax=Candoia aspera TaxID=51853 RepID=UPI002FD7EA83
MVGGSIGVLAHVFRIKGPCLSSTGSMTAWERPALLCPLCLINSACKGLPSMAELDPELSDLGSPEWGGVCESSISAFYCLVEPPAQAGDTSLSLSPGHESSKDARTTQNVGRVERKEGVALDLCLAGTEVRLRAWHIGGHLCVPLAGCKAFLHQCCPGVQGPLAGEKHFVRSASPLRCPLCPLSHSSHHSIPESRVSSIAQNAALNSYSFSPLDAEVELLNFCPPCST